MSIHVQFDQVATRDEASFDDDSEQLEAFRTGDFGTAMEGEVAKVFKRATKGALTNATRYFPLVGRVCRDKSSHYVKRPSRSWGGVPKATGETFDRVYRRSGVDLALAQAAQKSVAQNSVVIAVDRIGPERVRLASFIAAEVDVDRADDMLEDDLRRAKHVILRVPVRKDSHSVYYGRRVYTATEAWTEAPRTREKVGIFTGSTSDFANPLGYIPVVGVRRVEAAKGWWLPPLPLDLASVQIGLILALSDIEHICRLKVPGREIMIGGAVTGIANRVEAGPEGILLVQGDAGQLEYQSHMLDPRIDRYLQAVETTLKVWANLSYVSHDGLWASSGITGDAKEVEREDLLVDRMSTEVLWQDAEQALAEVVADTLGMARPQLHTDYHYVRARQNDLQSMQSFVLAAATGLESATEKVAIEEGVTLERAAELVRDRLEAWGELLEAWRAAPAVDAPPGLDSIGTQVLSGGQSVADPPSGAAE